MTPTGSFSELRERNGSALLKDQILTMLRDVFQSNLIWSVNLYDLVVM
jgi:hypothetical protein